MPLLSSCSAPGLVGAGLFVALMVLLSLFRYVHDVTKLLVEGRFGDLAHFYIHTLVVWRGLDPFDRDVVAAVDAALRIGRTGGAPGYPPFFYVVMGPWIAVPFPLAARLRLLAGQLCLVAALALMLPERPRDKIRLAVAAFVVLNYQPLFEGMALGQASLVLLLLVTLAWWASQRGPGWGAAFALALAVHMKPQCGLLIPLLWVKGDGKLALRTIGAATLGLAIGLLVVGPHQHVNYLTYIFGLPDYFRTWSRDLSVHAVFQRLFATTEGGRVIGGICTLAFDAALLLLIVSAFRRAVATTRDVNRWQWALILTAIPLMSPLTEEHHLVLQVFSLKALILCDAPLPTGPDAVLLVAGVLLLGSRYSFEQFPAIHAGLPSLLLGGKTLGVMLVTAALLRRLRGETSLDRGALHDDGSTGQGALAYARRDRIPGGAG